ncbi:MULTISPECIES: DNA translocase FtsK [unclassified Aeromonas]|uniref:DNA translocase FtsK n=1 Tax=unclassified Aeromonas TaxID=257493 RepID=UPI00352980A3
MATGVDMERKPDPTPFSNPYNEARSVAKSPVIPVWSEPKPWVELSEHDDFVAKYEKAVAFVVETRNYTAASVQRLLKTSYIRAAQIVEKMEEEGIVSALNESGKREVLVPKPVRE